MQAAKRTDCFRGCLYFSVSRVYRHVDRLASQAFRPTGLSPSHAFILMSLDREPEGLSPSEVARALELDPSTVNRLVATLVEQGLVESSRSGRQVNLTLLKKGAALLPEVRRCWAALGKACRAAYGEDLSRRLGELAFRAADE